MTTAAIPRPSSSRLSIYSPGIQSGTGSPFRRATSWGGPRRGGGTRTAGGSRGQTCGSGACPLECSCGRRSLERSGPSTRTLALARPGARARNWTSSCVPWRRERGSGTNRDCTCCTLDESSDLALRVRPMGTGGGSVGCSGSTGSPSGSPCTSPHGRSQGPPSGWRPESPEPRLPPLLPPWGDSWATCGRGRPDRLAALRTQEVIWHVAEAVRRGRRGYITTPNAHHLVLVQRDPAFRKACGDAWLRVPDGMPLVWASRLLGRPLPERVTGADLLPALCDVASRAGYSIFLLGGRQGVAERAASRLRARFPELTIAGIYSPVDGFGDDTGDQAAALEAVNRARPDILFVGLGAPVQEVWVHRHWDRLACTVAICCGAALDYAAGEKPRAPYWTRHAGLEWAWRLACEPGRLWRRYLASALTVGCLFVREWWKLRAVRASE